MKKIVRLTESDLHRIVNKSVNRILREGNGDIITCYGSPSALKYDGVGTLLGPGVIYLSRNPGDARTEQLYGKLVPFKVDVSNFYTARDAREAMEIARLHKDEYSGVLYHGNHDGDICAVFDKSCILN